MKKKAIFDIDRIHFFYAMDIVSDIKARLSIEEVVGRYVQLMKVGNSYKALCPFHKEKTPSFVVSPEKQMAYCFGCHKGGDIFNFIQEIEGCDFREAIELLAEQSGIVVSKKDFHKLSPGGGRDQKVVLIEINEAAASFFEENLKNTTEGKIARDYLISRQVDPIIQECFRLGYAPNSFEELKNFLLKKGFEEAELIKAGVIGSANEGGSRTYDRFRDRLMFPIWNERGRISAFTGRTLDNEKMPKYLNSPETAIYVKGALLYGFSHAKEAIRSNKRAIIVEGNMDVLASHQAGVPEVVAASGTAISNAHLQFLKRYTTEIYLALDSDNAGQEALLRSIKLALNLGLRPYVINLKIAKDPDELIKIDAALWPQAIQKSEVFFDYFLEKKNQEVIEKKAERSEAINFLLELIHEVQNPLEQDEWIQKTATKFLLRPNLLYDQLARLKKQKKVIDNRKQNDTAPMLVKFSSEEYFWGLALENWHLLGEILPVLQLELFSESYSFLLEQIKKLLESQPQIEISQVMSQLDEVFQNKLKVLMLNADMRFVDATDEVKKKELLKIVDKLFFTYYDKSSRQILTQMKEAKQKGDSQVLQELLSKYTEVLNTKNFYS